MAGIPVAGAGRGVRGAGMGARGAVAECYPGCWVLGAGCWVPCASFGAMEVFGYPHAVSEVGWVTRH